MQFDRLPFPQNPPSAISEEIITLKARGEFLHEQQLEEDEPPSCTDHHPLVLMENSYLANHALVLL